MGSLGKWQSTWASGSLLKLGRGWTDWTLQGIWGGTEEGST